MELKPKLDKVTATEPRKVPLPDPLLLPDRLTEAVAAQNWPETVVLAYVAGMDGAFLQPCSQGLARGRRNSFTLTL